MATVTSYTSAAIDAALAAKADLAGGVLPDAQAPAISVKKDTLFINIMDHGAHGDGITPDDAAFISGLAAINPTVGGKLYLPAGRYLLNGSVAITLAVFGTTLCGAGSGNTQILIGSGFTDTAAIKITANNCHIENLSIAGNNGTITSNPVADAIYVNHAQQPNITDCSISYINGWAIQLVSGSTGGTNVYGAILRDLIIQNCAGGVHFFGNPSSGSTNTFMTDVQISYLGVTSGASANLDAIKLEDAWDVTGDNVTAWMGSGTGNALHVKGLCIYTTFVGVNLKGNNTAPVVLLENGTSGSPVNTRIAAGVVQFGTIGLRITGAASIVHMTDLSFVGNKTHGLSVETSGNPTYSRGLYFENNGTGASGSNYDINWTGTGIGFIEDARFQSALTSIGVAGVQNSVNVPALQGVRCINLSFSGSGASSANWFTNIPNAVLETSAGTFNFLTAVNFATGLSTSGNVVSSPAASTGVVFSAKVPGDGFDRLRITGDGNVNIGTGAAARDTTWGRQGVAQIGTADSDVIIGLAGKGLRIKEGTNARMGTATLVAGTVTVANTSITANTRIVLASKAPAGTVGALFVSAVTVATSFVIKSTSATDTSVVGYVLFEAA